MAQYGDDEIFYGSIPVYLKSVPGKIIAYIHSHYSPDTVRDNNNMPTNTLSRKDEIPHSDGGPPIVVPCMPCLDLVGSEESTDLSEWPELLRSPLIKVPESESTTKKDYPDLKAFASGVRSACVKIDNKWYRLKGSGNNDQGFPVKTSSQVVETGKPPIKTRQIRGSAFVHTARCENYYSSKLAKEMDQHNIYGANGSMGYYEYGGKDQLPLGLENKEFQTACIIETTRGDRRFGTHVIAGLTLLLSELLDDSKLGNMDELLDLFPNERKSFGQVPFAAVPNFFDDTEIPILKTSDLFGCAQLKFSELFMQRPAKGRAREESWNKLMNMMNDSINKDKPTIEELQGMCKHICSTKLVGTETNVAELVGVDSGTFGSWMGNDYNGDEDIFTPTWRMLQLWKNNGEPITDSAKVIVQQLPKITRNLLTKEKTASGMDVTELFAFAATVPKSNALPKQFYKDENADVEGEKDCDPKWSSAWKEACDVIHQYNNAINNDSDKKKKQSALMYIYSRLGYECGRFAKLLHHKCHTSWGTYQDKICHESGWHCNAHANNMVIMAPGHSDDTYLSYLDLDMAFDRETVVDVKPSSDTYGKVGQTEEEFDLLLIFENYNFMEVIAGNDSSTGVPKIAENVVNTLSPTLQVARSVLYDTMLNGYMYAYYEEDGRGVRKKGEQRNNVNEYSVADFDPELHEVGMALIKLAIIKQADYIA